MEPGNHNHIPALAATHSVDVPGGPVYRVATRTGTGT